MIEEVSVESPLARAKVLVGDGMSWGAIFSGALVAVITQLALGMLGLAVGASTINPITGHYPAAIGIGTGIWLLFTAIISLFTGGFVAGLLSCSRVKLDGALHGVVAWALASLASIYLLTTALGSLAGGVASLVGHGLAAAGPHVAAAAMEQQGPEVIVIEPAPHAQQHTRQPAQQALEQKELTPAPVQAQNQAQDQQLRARAAEKARRAADATAKAVSKAALWTFFLMLLGGISAAAGGIVGTLRPGPRRRRTLTRRGPPPAPRIVAEEEQQPGYPEPA